MDLRLLVLLRTRLRYRRLERAMVCYTAAGETGRVWIAGALAGALADRPRRSRWLWAALGVPLTLGMNFCVKLAVRRRRPRLEGIAAAAACPDLAVIPVGACGDVVRGRHDDRLPCASAASGAATPQLP